jgi:hypothetical protein
LTSDAAPRGSSGPADAPPSGTAGVADPGSFRDRGNRVFHCGGAVFRALGERSLAGFTAASRAPFFSRAVGAGRIVASEPVDAAALPLPPGGPWAGVLRHERIPFVSYPYEWTFGMLRHAALLQLELLDEALADGFILKDASSYNVQWRGASPVFIDVGSFERHADGVPWIAYRQFCQLFLYPLFLQAYLHAPFQPWLRGRIDGIAPEEFAALVGARDLLRPGVFVHGWLHARASARYASGGGGPAGLRFSREMIRANVRGLLRLVRRLGWNPGRSTWADYAKENSYGEADREAKVAFVSAAVGARRRSLVWDLGSNTGTYARIAAAGSDLVLAIDGDQLAVERLFRALRDERESRILPLVVNLADPSPGLGWRGCERRPLLDRGRPDLVLALALIHHLVLAANIPLDEVVTWLAELGAELVIEFVEREDPMVRRLLEGRPEFPDYNRDHFERCIAQHFEPIARAPLPGATRVLYHLAPRRR